MLPVVWRIAWRRKACAPSRIELQDLVAAGSLGLAMAVERCSTRPDDEFKAYAVRRIDGAMLDELRMSDPLGRRLRDRVGSVRRAHERARVRLGRSPEPHEVAEEAALPISSYEATIRAAADADALQGIALSLLASSESAVATIETAIDMRRRWGLVEEALSSLEPRLKEVVMALFFEGLAIRSLARRLGVSDSRVCQLRRRALEAMRATVERRERPGFP